eukprot:s1015_g22.t1
MAEELVSTKDDRHVIGHYVASPMAVASGGFQSVFWDAPRDLRRTVDDLLVLFNHLRCVHGFAKGVCASMLVLCSEQQFMTCYCNMASWIVGKMVYVSLCCPLVQAPRPRLGQGCSCVQAGVGFLGGSRYDTTIEDREECYSRGTVAFSRAIECTYIVSGPDMAALPAVYHKSLDVTMGAAIC